MSSTLSMFVNRVTVCLTSRQRDWLYAGMKQKQVGLSEYIRRKLDDLMDAEDVPPVPRVGRS